MRCRIPTVNDLRRTIFGIIQSTGFLTTSAFTYSLFLCLIRYCVGSFNFYTVSFVPAFMSSMCALLIERPSRRGLLCLYVSNVATETLFNMACSRGYCRPIPYGQVLIFGASMSVLLYYFRRGLHQQPIATIQSINTINNNTIVVSHTNKDSIYDILRFVVGRHEECLAPLQLQPQFLSRRRERSSANIIVPSENHQRQYTNALTNNRTGHPINNLMAVIMQAVQYYTKLVDYFKYRLPRHRTCPHPRNSCLHYVISGGAKLFTIGVGLQVTLTLIKLKMTSRLPWLQQLKQVFSSRNTLKLGTFLGGFATIFRVSFDFYFFFIFWNKCELEILFQLSSCSLRHIFGKDDPTFAIPSAFLASTAFASYPDTTVALYVFWKSLQVSHFQFHHVMNFS